MGAVIADISQLEASTHGDMMGVNNNFKIAHSNSTFIVRWKVKPIFKLDIMSVQRQMNRKCLWGARYATFLVLT